MKRSLTVWTLGFATLLMLLSCSEKQAADWTILVYMAADNGLNSAALVDIEEMQAAIFSDAIKVIVQIDESEYSSEPGAKRYEILPDNKVQIDYLGEIDSGDPAILTQFANWGFRKYPSEKKALIIWSHGNGWYPAGRNLPPSLCPDESSQSFISVVEKELQNALKNIQTKLDILIFDACNMQTLEVINEVYYYTDYIVAAEDEISNEGYPYDLILSSWEDHSSVQSVVENIAFNFHYYNWLNDSYPISCSALKTAMFPQLREKLITFVENWQEQANDATFLSSRAECIEFNGSFVSLATDVDIKQFFSNVLSHQPGDSLTVICNEIIAAVDECFFFQKTDIYPTGYVSDTVGTGLIWFPDEDTSFLFEDRQDEYLQLDFSNTGWQLFLHNTFQ